MGAAYLDEGRPAAGRRRRNVGIHERRLSLLGGLAAATAAIRRGGPAGVAMGALAAALLYRGGSGYCPINRGLGRNTARPGEQGLLRGLVGGGRSRPESVLRATVAVDREVAGLYGVWRGFSRLPEFMHHIDEVSPRGGNRWHWVADAPGAGRIEWDAELIAEEPGRRLAWRAVDGSPLDAQGEVDFRALPGAAGSLLQVELRWRPRDAATTALAQALSVETLQQDLERFKRLMEAAEPARAGIESPPLAQ